MLELTSPQPPLRKQRLGFPDLLRSTARLIWGCIKICLLYPYSSHAPYKVYAI